jgi:hypothetical protein
MLVALLLQLRQGCKVKGRAMIRPLATFPVIVTNRLSFR